MGGGEVRVIAPQNKSVNKQRVQTETRVMISLLKQVIIFPGTFIFFVCFSFPLKSISCIIVKLEYKNEHSLTN